MIPTISDYYRSAIEALKKEVEATADADVIGRDYDDWYAYLIDKHGMVPIEIDASRSEQLVEVEREHVLRGYDIYTDRMPGSVVKTNDVRIEVPVVPSDTLEVIVNEHLATNPFSISFGYPPFEYDHGRGVVSMVAAATKALPVFLDTDLGESNVQGGGRNGWVEKGDNEAVGAAAGAGPLTPGQRWSAGRKRDVVLRLLRGDSLAALSREVGVEIYRLEAWRERAMAGLELGLQDRQGEPLAAALDAAKRHIGELSMEVELLRARARAAEQRLPLAMRRSRR